MGSPSAPLEVVVATGNQGKAREFGRLLGATFRVQSLPEWVAAPPETGETFAENARQKAEAVFLALGKAVAVLADDSGLEVEALRGLPGVRSARFAGEGATDQENVDKLLHELGERRDRAARFVCHLALVVPGAGVRDPEARLLECRGTLEGTIEMAPRGAEGFGYDPVFRPVGSDKTLSEMSPEEKDALSHRARAVAALICLVGSEGAPSGGA